MKLSNGITLFNKQSQKARKINKNDILGKNINFSTPIIDGENTKTKEKNYLEQKDKEKVILIKSFCNKYERNSRPKSNSISKEYKRRNKSNNINNNSNNWNSNINPKNNTSYNKNKIKRDTSKYKYIFSPYVLTPLFGMKIYDNVVNKLFSYIQHILPTKIYIDIKRKFIKFVLEELRVKNDSILNKKDNEIMNVNLKLFYNKASPSSVNRSGSKIKKKKKNVKDFSFTRNKNNNKTINNFNYNTAKSNISKQYIFNGLLKNHNSLYSLNKKSAKVYGGPFNVNISKSPGKSKSKSNSKEKKTINKNIRHNYYSNNTIFEPDLHALKIFNHNKKGSKNKNKNSKENKNKNRQYISNNLIWKKKNNPNISIRKKITSNNLNLEKKIEKINYEEGIMNIENEEGKVNNKNKKTKNDEQLKQIKSGLDDNLKILFNFSYENFLNKESESESKKSGSEYNIKDGNENQKNK